MKLKPVYKWKRYRGLTRRGMFVFHGLTLGAVMFAVWFLFPGLRDPARET